MSRVEVVTAGCSIRPEYPEAKIATLIPLEVIFSSNNVDIPYSEFDISLPDFYQKMKRSATIPKTSGAITGCASQTYSQLSETTNSIISIQISSKLSEAFFSAELAKEIVQKEGLLIEVIDSEQVSMPTWFLTERAAELSEKGASLEEIKSEVLQLLPKVHIFTALETTDNLKQSGRLKEAFAKINTILKVHPIVGLKDGKLTFITARRTFKQATDTIVEMVGDSNRIVKIAVLHANAYEKAKELAETLRKIFRGEILIRDAGPAIACHAGEGALAVAFQTI